MTSTTSRTTAPATPTAPRPSLARLSAVELRKSVDTRAGRWLLAVLAALAVAGAAYRLLGTGSDPVTYRTFCATPLGAVRQVLPVLGVLAMTSEWTQRTALTTFTLVPQRGRVLVAKLVAAVALTVAVVLVVAVAAAAAALVAGAWTGDPVRWGGAAGVARVVGGAAAGSVLSMLLGAGLGALLQQTAAALVAYFVAPTLVTVAAVELVGDRAVWVSAPTALARVADLDLGGALVPTLAALVLWVVLPLTAGAVRTQRREVV